MTAEEIEKYLSEINDELAAQDVIGEICIYGGAAMCLAFKARPATKDVDAIFEPVKIIRSAINKIAEKYNLNDGWLNFAVKMFVVEHEKNVLLDLSNLKVYAPTADYLLAMKVLALRAESFDADDIRFFDKAFEFEKMEDVLKIVADYYPKKSVKPETKFQLEEIFGKFEMITIRETKEKINADKTWWKVYFYDFVDDFRYHKNLEAVSQPFVFDNNKFDALLASTVEALCAEMNLETPEWTKDVPACEKPFFVAGFENLKATAIVESPLAFRIRKVFVTSSFLQRV